MKKWIIAEGKSIYNLSGRHYYSGQTLPDGYQPPADYVKNKIVVQKTEKGAK